MVATYLPDEYAELAAVQSAEEEGLLAKRNVVGVALGTKYTRGRDTETKAVTVLVESKTETADMLAADDRVPDTLGKNNVPTDVQEVGILQAGQITLSASPAAVTAPPAVTDGVAVATNGHPHVIQVDDTARAAQEQVGPFTLARRVRPAFGGVSVGHFRISAGTLGTCCYDRQFFPGMPARYYILSNNHVLANSNAASIGDPILQPGPADGGTFPDDVIARLTRFVPIRFIQAGQPVQLNLVDAAIAEGQFHDLDRRIYWVGNLKGVSAAPQPGNLVQKCGRTTNYTTGRIRNINATVDVNYTGGRVARFAEQILATPMGAPGDSGSLVADLNERAVGLLFAGSQQVTIINRISRVQQLLGILVSEG